MAEQNSLERLLGRDKTITSFMLVLMTALTAAYTIFGVGMPMSALDMTISMSGPTSQMPMMIKPMWTINYTILVFLMWWIMMVAMMLPSAAPTILLYTALIRKANKAENIKKMIMVFTLGYLITWAFFSLLATLLQSGLEAKEWMSPMMMTLTNDILIAITLIIAGFCPHTVEVQCKTVQCNRGDCHVVVGSSRLSSSCVQTSSLFSKTGAT